MKSYILLVAFFTITYWCRAQEKVLFFDADGLPVKEKKAVVLQQRIKLSDSLWEINLYRVNGPRDVSIQCKDEEGNVPNGRYISYDPVGNCDTIGQYRNGRREGNWQVYTIKGRLLQELTYSGDVLIGQRDSAQVNKESKEHYDSLYAGRKIVEVESSFPGGVNGWLRYLGRNQKYPEDAVNKGIQGNPIVAFVVDKDGKVDQQQIYLFKSAEYSLDSESLRVIRGSPDWIPAVQDGRKVKSYKRQPIVYHL